MRMAGVEDHGLPAVQLMAEHASRAARTSARPCGHGLRGRVSSRVVIDVEVSGLEDLKVELLVLDFILSEVLRARRGGDEEDVTRRSDRE